MRAKIGLGNLCDSSIGPWTVWCSAWFPTRLLAVSGATSRPLPPQRSLVAAWAWDLCISCRSYNSFQSYVLLSLLCWYRNGTQADLLVLVPLVMVSVLALVFVPVLVLGTLPSLSHWSSPHHGTLMQPVGWWWGRGKGCGWAINSGCLRHAKQNFRCFHSRVL